MQIEQLKNALQHIFMQHSAEKVYAYNSTSSDVLSLYIVGCPRAKLPVIQENIIRALHCKAAVSVNYLESEVMMDRQIRDNGKLLYQSHCA